MSSYTAEDTEVDINDDVDLEIGSLKDQESTDLIDKARKVRFAIKKAEVRTSYQDGKKENPWNTKTLAVQAKISEDGTDGNGANANRVLFPEFMLAFNTEGDYAERANSDWWQKKARGPAKDFLAALGFDPAAPPRINKDFLDGLLDMEFIADITQKEREEKTNEKNDKGKFIYKKTGEYRNELTNFRQV